MPDKAKPEQKIVELMRPSLGGNLCVRDQGLNALSASVESVEILTYDNHLGDEVMKVFKVK